MILEQFSLEGRRALVTGGSQGLGQAYAVALAAAGADVALLDLTEPTETVELIRDLGRKSTSAICDLSQASAKELDDVVRQIAGALGGLDILVNNAGTIDRSPALDVSEEAWDRVLAVNLDAVFHLSQAAGRLMVEAGGGKIINIASMLSFQGGVLVPSYAASKHAVAGITKALANEWAALGINVNAVAPGYIETANTAPLRADAQREQAIAERIPAGRWGRPTDVAATIVFLASSAADYVHGAIIPVDGGWLSR